MEELYKIIGGDWGNNYGYVKALENGMANIEIMGLGIVIEHDYEQLQAVPFFGA